MATDVNGGESCVHDLQMDEAYEFCAPRFFDFMNDETEEEIQRAELWFETSLSYAPSPFMPRIKEGRSVQLDSLCDFGEVNQSHKESDPMEANNQRDDPISSAESTRHASELIVEAEVKAGYQQEVKDGVNHSDIISDGKACKDSRLAREDTSVSVDVSSTASVGMNQSNKTSSSVLRPSSRVTTVQAMGTEACTPKAQRVPVNGAPTSSKNQTANRIASLIKKPSAITPKNHPPSLQTTKITKSKSVNRCPGSITAKSSMAIDIAQENQAIKRQKLEGGKSRQILNVKNRVLPHKSKPGSTGGADIFASAVKGHQEERKEHEATPFISMAEMVKKFQSNTREIELSQNRSFSQDDTASMIQRRPRLTLTRPKEPTFETSHRVRAVRVKSSAELEEEMLAKIPKFRARPVNKKILEAPSFPSLPRSAPQPPQFQEFHLKTMERANQHAGTSSVLSSSTDALSQVLGKPNKLTDPRPPVLETSLRARPTKIKSSRELELEELEKIPKFKARPLNKKILESKGDLGLFCNQKRQVTTPQEFHFATNERIGPPAAAVMDLFDKLSLHPELSHHGQQEIPNITIPNPFHLRTEERGLEKERQFEFQILQKQLQEERARIPKANPYPYTTDYPVAPPKPEPKKCTKPEAFQLESLMRHEEEMQRQMEEKERMEKEESQRRIFRAQPILKEDPLPLPERERKPLTEVQEFQLQVDHRAIERSEFDKKIKEKEMVYKRLREEYESAKMIEEEKAVKQMRRTMVPHARPLPNFDNPFQPRKSVNETTKPKSPNLHVVRREEKRRCTSHMR